MKGIVFAFIHNQFNLAPHVPYKKRVSGLYVAAPGVQVYLLSYLNLGIQTTPLKSLMHSVYSISVLAFFRCGAKFDRLTVKAIVVGLISNWEN